MIKHVQKYKKLGSINSLDGKKQFLSEWKSLEAVIQRGSRTIALEENCLPTPKLTLTQTLAITGGGQLFSGAIVWSPPNPKTNPDLDPNPNPNQGAIFLGGQLSGYHPGGVL